MSEDKDATTPNPPSALGRIVLGFLKLALPVAVLVGAALLYQFMMATAPQAGRKPSKRQARLVEVVPAQLNAGEIRIAAKGVVKPALDVTLSPQVSGVVVEMNEGLVPGGRFNQGDTLLRIDAQDYGNVIRQIESEIIRARAAITLEEGNRDVALQEYEVLGEDLSAADKALVFRKPQMESAKADLASASARLKMAELDLQRTTVTAPFDALVVREDVDMGTRLSTQSAIARLVGTDSYWVEVSLAQSDLRWVNIPTTDAPGSLVTLQHPKAWGTGATRQGHVIRLLPDISEQGRMARLLVEVEDPLALNATNGDVPRLLIEQYLEAEIIGKRVEGAIRIAREHLRNGDYVWVMDSENTLEIRKLDIIYSATDAVLVRSGVVEGEHIVTTDLSMATEGMELRTAGEGDAPGADS